MVVAIEIGRQREPFGGKLRGREGEDDLGGESGGGGVFDAD